MNRGRSGLKRNGGLLLLVFLALNGFGLASSITDLGSIYSLTNLGQQDAPGGTTDVWRILLTINPSSYTGNHSDSIKAVAPKVSSSISAANLILAPGGVAAWTTILGGSNSKGCSGRGSGYFCSQDGASAQVSSAPLGGFQWEWDITIPIGTLFTAPFESSIKAEYYNSNGKFSNQTSQPITLDTPEPASLLLLGSGLLALASLKRKRAGKA